MAKSWNPKNWTIAESGQSVSLMQAFGIEKGNVSFPKFNAQLPTAVSAAAVTKQGGGSRNTAATGSGGRGGTESAGGGESSNAPGGRTVVGHTSSGAPILSPATGSAGAPTSGLPNAWHGSLFNSGNSVAWANSVLSAGGFPRTTANQQSLIAWAINEGGGGAFNPLNSTQGPGSSFNSVGVRNYANWQVGAQQTAQTIYNGYYPNIVSDLRSGHGIGSNSSGDLHTWSGGGYGGISGSWSQAGNLLVRDSRRLPVQTPPKKPIASVRTTSTSPKGASLPVRGNQARVRGKSTSPTAAVAAAGGSTGYLTRAGFGTGRRTAPAQHAPANLAGRATPVIAHQAPPNTLINKVRGVR